MLVPVVTLDAPGLEGYRHVAQPDRLAAAGHFVAEGRLVVARLIALGTYRLHSLLLTTAAAEAMAGVLPRVPAHVPIYVASHEVMNGVVGFNIHRGCLALAERPARRRSRPSDLAAADAAARARGREQPRQRRRPLPRRGGARRRRWWCSVPTAVTRSTERRSARRWRATLALPWRVAAEWPEALTAIRQAGLGIVACTPAHDAPSVYDVALPARAAVLVGAEGPGLSAAALATADLRVRIPMHGGIDSLNVVTAAAIVLSALDRRG